MLKRQKKLTEAFPQTKSTAQQTKLPVKRKLLTNGDENSEETSEQCILAVAVEVGLEDSFQLAKKALHTSRPSNLIARENQVEEVYQWLNGHLTLRTPGAMYISGAPGTGKTAVVTHSIHMCEQVSDDDETKLTKPSFLKLFVNCMSIGSANSIYDDIAKVLKLTARSKGDTVKEKVNFRLLSKGSKTKMMVLVLDEMDQLLQGKGNEVLYSLFEWARLPGSKFILIGIANALDLTVRHLPLLGISLNNAQNSPTIKRNLSNGSKTKKKLSENESEKVPVSVKVMNFPPYERTDIEKILEARLIQIGSEIFDPAAVKFVAAKVAASTGDMRKALNACKMALEGVEKQQRLVLKTTADDGFNFSSPKKCCVVREKIGVGTVAKVFGPQKDEGPLPLQQMIILATLLKINKEAPNTRQSKVDGVTSPIPMTFVYDEYRKICSTKGFSWIDRSEIVSVCNMLQDRSLVTVVENMTGGGAASKKFGSMNSKNKTGFMFEPKAVEKIVMQGDMKSVISNV